MCSGLARHLVNALGKGQYLHGPMVRTGCLAAVNSREPAYAP